MTDAPRSAEPPPRVFLAAAALHAISAEIRTAPANLETGGILLGQGDGLPDFYVMRAGGPGPKALHEPTRFIRDLDYATALARQAWADVQAVWIGEWHTHPIARPVPSETDLNAYLRHLQDPELGFKRFLSLIIAPTTPTTKNAPEVGELDEPGDPASPGAKRVAALTAWVVAPEQAVLAELLVLEAEKGTDG